MNSEFQVAPRSPDREVGLGDVEDRTTGPGLLNGLNITAKIWLSISVFILGFVLLTVVVQVQDLNTEENLRRTSEGLFPATQNAEKALAAYQQMIKGFHDAVLVQDAAALNRPAEDGKASAELLSRVASARGLSSQRASEARQLAAAIAEIVDQARTTYASALGDSANMTEETQSKLGQLSSRIEATNTDLQTIGQHLSQDLQDEMRQLQAHTSRQRWTALFVCLASLILAGTIVHYTIRRAIAQPIQRAVAGLQQVTEESSQAARRMAESGQSVARDAEEQATFIHQTSTSLERIAATTNENAGRASEADQLMREATETVREANLGMDALTNSMSAISESSKQVSDVLKSIDEIAFQTNILALNAAVEAARAGQAGAGFSVVAGEVRSLAQRAAEAAGRSARIIEKTMIDIRAGVQQVSTAQSAFKQVSSRIERGTAIVAQIAQNSGEQAHGITDIGATIDRIETVTQNNAMNAKQSAEAASDVDAQIQTTRQYLEGLAAVLGLVRSR